ncbi:replicative DNA helicase [Oceanivirga salmonicida]|uniref:replicative DNA helicase n=1 Tax=Oceanivirga salmonicida TaxID=1769291 RepID=UPI00082F80B3|nr:replicative DNA helicase [Oceanivirga salmonicida]
MEENNQTRLEIEEIVLGILISNPELVSEVNNKLRMDDFSISRYAKLYDAMQYLSGEYGEFDILVLEDTLRSRGILEELGGRNKITSLISNAPLVIDIETYINILKNKSIQSKLNHACLEIQDEIKREHYDYKDLMEIAQRKILAVDENENTVGVISIKDVADKKFTRLYNMQNGIDEKDVIKTNFTEYDRITRGLNKSDLLILAARPAMGKTAFALNLATNVAKQGKTVLIFSLEMGNEQLLTRILSSVANVEMNKLVTNRLNDTDLARVNKAIDEIKDYDLFISEKAGVSMLEIRNIARRFKTKYNLDFLVIDYLQLISSSSSKYGSREQEVSEISRSLKNLARELDIPVLALSQLSRGVESRSDKRPLLSDLRESGSIEQDADQVMFLFREQYYKNLEKSKYNNNSDEEKDDNNKTYNADEEIAELIIGKHRNGETGTINLAINFKYQRFKSVHTKY